MRVKLIFTICLIFSAQLVWAKQSSLVSITWGYEKFPLKMKLYEVKPGKEGFISETGVVAKLSEAPVGKVLKDQMQAPWKGSAPAVLVLENPTAHDLYFFAVPHEMNPHHASAGHYFECLCVNRVFKVPAHKTWYRIVRLNLNDSFQGLAKFTIHHQIVGVKESDALTTYKERLYVAP